MSAELQAALERDPAQAEVRIRYLVRPDSAGAVVPVAALPLAGVQLVEMVVATGSAAPVPLALAAATGPAPGRFEGRIRLAPDAEPGAVIPIEIYYRVIGPTREPAYPRRIELPVIAVLWPPERAVPGTFRGTVSVHPGLSLRDAFPADLGRGAADEEGAGGGRVHTFDLPVTTALVAFTLSSGGGGPGLVQVLDAAALLAILVFGYVGWRRFRAEM